MECFKKIVEMCEIYYGMSRERIKVRDEGRLEGISQGGGRGKRG